MSLSQKLYKHRGLIPVLPILGAIVFGRYEPGTWFLGLLMMVLGESLRFWGAAYLGLTARSSSPKSAKLVTKGPFAHTRHPLYLGNALLTAGFVIASGAGWPWFVVIVLAGYLLLYSSHARREEDLLAETYPIEWWAYAKSVPRVGWLPFPARVKPAGEAGPPSWAQAWRVERWTLHAEAWLIFLLWLRFRFF